MRAAATSRPRIRVPHFGLGTQTKVSKLTVRWPDGTVTVERDIPANQIVTVAPANQAYPARQTTK